MKLKLYRLIMFLIKPLVRPVLKYRQMRGDEPREEKRLDERFGIASAARPKGRLIWFHAASIGESNIAISVMDRLLEKYADATILITTMTVNGAENIARKLGANRRVIHQFLPIDRGAYARKFLSHWKPTIGLFIGSDLWPNMLRAAAMRSIPLILLNGQISERSYRRWMTSKGSIRRILANFIYMFASGEKDKKRLLDMGAKIVLSVGNLKYARPAPWVDVAKEKELAAQIAGRKVWVAADIHDDCFKLLKNSDLIVKLTHKDSLMILVPHNPSHGRVLEEFWESKDYKVARRSKGEKITAETEVYVADTVGEIGLFYKLADVAFIGGSLIPKYYGHNPFEAAHLGKPIVSGVNVSAFAEMYDMLEKENAVLFVKDENELGNTVSRLFSDDDMRKGYAERAYKVAKREADVVDRVMDKVMPIIDAVG